MIECYSNNVTVGSGNAVPFNNTVIKKGCTVEKSGASVIQFNTRGIYSVDINASVKAESLGSGSSGLLSIQLYKNGVAQSQAVSSTTASDTTSTHALSFTTLVQVPEDNSCCPCTSPTQCEILCTGIPAVIDNINVKVTKIV